MCDACDNDVPDRQPVLPVFTVTSNTNSTLGIPVCSKTVNDNCVAPNIAYYIELILYTADGAIIDQPFSPILTPTGFAPTPPRNLTIASTEESLHIAWKAQDDSIYMLDQLMGYSVRVRFDTEGNGPNRY